MNKSYLIIGDLHIDSNFKDLDFINMLSEEIDFNTVVFLGDFFDNSYNIKKNDIKRAIEFIKKIDKKIIIISGNHDIFGCDINKNNNLFLYGIDKFKNVEFVLGQNQTYIDDNFIFISYYLKQNDLYNDLISIKNYIKNSDYNKYFIFSHNDIGEFYVGSPAKNFISVFNIFRDLEDKEIYFISGHIHDHRFIRNNNVNIISIGSLCSKDFRSNIDFPIFIHIDYNENINLYKYINNNAIFKRFLFKDFNDLKHLYNFISIYRFFIKNIKISVLNNYELYNYLVNNFKLFESENMKQIGIKKVVVNMINESSDERTIFENSLFINQVDIDSFTYLEDEDIYFQIIEDYVNSEYKSLSDEEKNKKIEFLYNVVNYINSK